MSDRELLELAAKAAGIEIEWFPARVWDAVMEGYFDALDGSGAFAVGDVEWNPLEHDGDALRLAVKLRISVNQWSNGVSTTHGPTNREFPEDWGGDPFSATRRAIVRAAAEIGKAMP